MQLFFFDKNITWCLYNNFGDNIDVDSYCRILAFMSYLGRRPLVCCVWNCFGSMCLVGCGFHSALYPVKSCNKLLFVAEFCYFCR